MRTRSTDVLYKWFISMIVGLAVWRFYAMRMTTLPPLHHFKERIIGLPVFLGFDASLRTKYYAASLVLFLVGFLATFFLLTRMSKWLLSQLPKRFVLKQFVLGAEISVFALFVILLNLFNGTPVASGSAPILILFSAFPVLLMLVMCLLWNRISRMANVYRIYPIESLALAVPFIFISIQGAVLRGELTVSPVLLAEYWGLVVLTLLLFPLLVKGQVNDQKVQARAMSIAVTGLLCIPLALPFVQELHYRLSPMVSLAPQTIAVALTCFLFLISLALYRDVSLQKRCSGMNARRFAVAVHVPLVLVSLCFLSLYKHTRYFGSVDLLHHGQARILWQQFRDFGQIPFVDIMPVHGLVDVFGHSSIAWVIVGISMLAVYAVLKITTRSSSFSLLVTVATPTTVLFNPLFCYFYVSLGPFLLLYLLLRIRWPSFLICVLFWSTVIVSMLWQYDVGFSAAIAVTLILAGETTSRHGIKSGLRKLLHPIMSSGLLVAGVFGITFVLISIINDRNPLELLGQAARFLTSQAQAQSRIKLWSGPHLLAVLEYLVFPAIGLFYMGYWFSSLLRKKATGCRRAILISIAIWCLLYSLRNVQRHTLVELYQVECLALLLCAIPFFFFAKRTVSKLAFLGIYLVYCILLTAVAMTPNNHINYSTKNSIMANWSLENGKPLFEFRLQDKNPARIKIDNVANQTKLKRFFDELLLKEQTFADLANAPMLYPLTNRQFPNYLIPSVIWVGDRIQNFEISRLDSLRKQGKLAAVVSRVNRLGHDDYDLVSNKIRNYRITEYIYKYFRPLGYVNQHEIWVAKDLPPSRIPKTQIIRASLKINDETAASQTEPRSTGLKERCSVDLPQSERSTLGRQLYVEFVYHSSSTFSAFLESGVKKKKSSEGVFYKTPSVSQRAIFPLEGPLNSNSTLHLLMPDYLSTRDVRIESAFLISTPENSYLPFSSGQDFDLQLLPYFWGTYDAGRAAETAKNLYTFFREETTLLANNPLHLERFKDIDKTSGNYLHLRIRCNRSGTCLLEMGEKFPSSIEFNLVPSDSFVDYLVRVSSLWSWNEENIDRITMTSSVDTTLEIASILKGY